ncbi:MAG TPA: hypothetical protein VG709_02345, partial [Actinomycetota bacterium]|nr:hypothetical protein [Actinomycetota bacterium]
TPRGPGRATTSVAAGRGSCTGRLWQHGGVRRPTAGARRVTTAVVALIALGACGGDVDVTIGSPQAGPSPTDDPVVGPTALPSIPGLPDIDLGDLTQLTDGEASVEVSGDVESSIDASLSVGSGVAEDASAFNVVYTDANQNTVTITGAFDDVSDGPQTVVNIALSRPSFVLFTGTDCNVSVERTANGLEGSFDCDGLTSSLTGESKTIDAEGEFTAST